MKRVTRPLLAIVVGAPSDSSNDANHFFGRPYGAIVQGPGQNQGMDVDAARPRHMCVP
jgi:hypothetical protein